MMSFDLPPTSARFLIDAVLAAFTLLLLASSTPAQQPAIDPALAGSYFAEARGMCTADGGRF